MRKHALKGISVCLMVTMLGGALAGCGASETKTEEYKGEAAVTEETAQAPASDETQSEQTDSYETGDVAAEAEQCEEISDVYDDLYEWNVTADAAGNGEARKQMEDAKTTYLYPDYYEPANTEEYEKAEENGFCITAVQPLSTFSADVDTASYANVRRMIEDGYSADRIDPAAVRPEEFINYFSYDLNAPKKGDMFGVTAEVAACPWNRDHELMMVGMTTEEIDMSKAPDSNLVFLLDVSGSMDESDKLPLLQKSFIQLVEEIGEHDTVSIVTYASGVNTVLEGANGNEKDRICAAIGSLYAGGGTNGEGGIQKAYELAEANFIKGGNNRVILATDGDLNIGISEPDELEKFIEQKRKSGVYLSVLGFGTGNIKDNNMERLADCGNGNYSYIDSLFEAKKVLVEEMGSTLLTIAEDVKLQVEFNPQKVNAYRLIGYENRMMAATDFNDDTKDAGEIGAGHSVVALYEIIPAGAEDEIALKYQDNKAHHDVLYTDYATVSVRYKEPGQKESKKKSYVVAEEAYANNPSDDFVFASLVAEFAMILSDSDNKGTSDFETILDTYKTLDVDDEYKDEFYYLVKQVAKR